jgi:hypothetical protein
MGRDARGYGQQRITIQVGGADAQHQITGAGTERSNTHTRYSGQPTHRPGHKGRCGFMTGKNKLNASPVQRVDQFNHFSTRMPERIPDTRVI